MYEIGPFDYTFKQYDHSSIVPKKIFSKETILILKNELVVIAGPSGGGKSTLLKLLKGIIPEFDSGILNGKILYQGHPLGGDFFKQNIKKIMFLFQNPFSQLIYEKVAEEFFFSMENFNYSKSQMDQKRIELQTYFDLEHLWHKKTNQLSNGECQRLVLSSLLAIDPEVLLLDEPTAFLDPLGRKDFYHWLSLEKGKRTIILVDHHLDEILPYAQKIIYVDQEGEVQLKKNLPEEVPTIPPVVKINGIQKNNIQLIMTGIFFHYPDQKALLQNISLAASSSDIVVIKGKNGKGKSTLFKIMAHLQKPLKGKVEILKNNQPLGLKFIPKEIGFIFQNPESHFFYDTIKEELKNLEDKNLLDLLKIFFKDIDLSRSPYLLSEGEKRRLSILMTVFFDKSILFYDEPTFGQDKQSIALIKAIILQLKSMGKLQFIISHDENFIHSLGARVYDISRL